MGGGLERKEGGGGSHPLPRVHVLTAPPTHPIPIPLPTCTRAVAAARQAFDQGEWPRMSGKERGKVRLEGGEWCYGVLAPCMAASHPLPVLPPVSPRL